jgi:hypothetical protein
MVNALAILFPSGQDRENLATIVRIKSEIEATELGIVGLWCLHRFAAAARSHWENNPELVKRGPDALLLAWATSMIEAYERVVEADAPRWNEPDGPFMRFCEAVRERVMQATTSDPASDRVTNELRAALKRARPIPFSHFIERNYKAARAPAN